MKALLYYIERHANATQAIGIRACFPLTMSLKTCVKGSRSSIKFALYLPIDVNLLQEAEVSIGATENWSNPRISNPMKSMSPHILFSLLHYIQEADEKFTKVNNRVVSFINIVPGAAAGTPNLCHNKRPVEACLRSCYEGVAWDEDLQMLFYDHVIEPLRLISGDNQLL